MNTGVITIIDGTVSMKESYFNAFFENVSKISANIGAKAAIKAYNNEKAQETILTSAMAAQQLNVKAPTVAKYCRDGYKRTGILLKGKFKGNAWHITQLDLNEFKSKI